ncbi:MAG: hypothetical protein QF357_07380 [Dehalococcoidia bacterium]|jgi:hypothetical protein|nr:hypothetical protein [Dehalococcoidia bacterium]
MQKQITHKVVLVLFASLALFAQACDGGSTPDAENSSATTSSQLLTPAADVIAQSFTGSGDSVIETAKITSGVLVVSARHQGVGDFVVKLVASDINETVFDESGQFSGTTARLVSRGSIVGRPQGSILLEITASGEWTIDLPREVPLAGQSPPIKLEDHGQIVEKWLNFQSGEYVLSAQHDGNGNFQVRLIHSTGSQTNLVVNEVGSYSGDIPLQVASYGPGIMEPGFWALVVVADGDWSVNIR